MTLILTRRDIASLMTPDDYFEQGLRYAMPHLN